jgi:Carbamoylphosphate synthase large subunit (split gene in MJ)
MPQINVMITGVGGGGVGEQILKCLRISSLKYNIVGCDMNRNSMGLSKVDKAYIVPPASHPHYVEILLKICKINRIQVLFHGSEPEMKALSKNREIFKENQIYIPFNSENVIETCMNKYLTMKFLQENGFEIPKYWEIKEERDLEKVDIFPIVLKPSVGGGGSVNTFIAQNFEELRLFGKYLLKIYNQFLAQEYIGTADSEYTVGVLHSSKGEYINSIAVKKNILSGLSNKTRVANRTDRNDLGNILAISSGVSQGEIGRFKEVTEPCKRIAEKLGCTAALNIQCRIYNHKMYVFEINPRISGTSSLRAMVGYNEPDILVRENILGENIERDFMYQSGYIARGLAESFIAPKAVQALNEEDEK